MKRLVKINDMYFFFKFIVTIIVFYFDVQQWLVTLLSQSNYSTHETIENNIVLIAATPFFECISIAVTIVIFHCDLQHKI